MCTIVCSYTIPHNTMMGIPILFCSEVVLGTHIQQTYIIVVCSTYLGSTVVGKYSLLSAVPGSSRGEFQELKDSMRAFKNRKIEK